MFLVQQTLFFAYVIYQKRSTNQQKQLQKDVFHVKTSLSAKNKLDPAGNEIGPKSDVCPFAQKPSITFSSYSLFEFLLGYYIYLLLTEFEVRTVSYGPSFFPFAYTPSAKRAGHKSTGKNEDP